MLVFSFKKIYEVKVLSWEWFESDVKGHISKVSNVETLKIRLIKNLLKPNKILWSNEIFINFKIFLDKLNVSNYPYKPLIL